jgi:hypothetical protein
VPTKYRRRSSTKVGGTNRSGVAWFEPEEYARILEIMNYPPDMSRDYERWRELAEGRQRGRKGNAGFIVRVVVHPEEFVGWCASKAIQPDYGALNTFVYERATGHAY